jgi:hypothetical protein
MLEVYTFEAGMSYIAGLYLNMILIVVLYLDFRTMKSILRGKHVFLPLGPFE